MTAALVAIERRAFDEASQYLRQARREIRGIDAPLASWRVEAVTATLLEKTAQPDSARRARQKYERALERLNRPALPDPLEPGRLWNPASGCTDGGRISGPGLRAQAASDHNLEVPEFEPEPA